MNRRGRDLGRGLWRGRMDRGLKAMVDLEQWRNVTFKSSSVNMFCQR